MSQAVTDYIAKLAGTAGREWQGATCTALRDLVLDTLPQAEERLQYGKPHFLVNGSYAAVISAAKDKVSFTIFNAQGIAENEPDFTSAGEGARKIIAWTKGQTVDTVRIGSLLKAASSAR